MNSFTDVNVENVCGDVGQTSKTYLIHMTMFGFVKNNFILIFLVDFYSSFYYYNNIIIT